MHVEAHCAVATARVGEGQLRQHDARIFDAGKTLLLLTAIAAPKLWGHLLDAALQGFEEGIASPHDGRVSTHLHQGFDQAQKRTRARVESLIERRPSDIGLLALGCDGPLLHVVCAGPQRAYLHRRGQLRQLTPVDDRAQGLLKATPAWSVEAVEPGDVLIAGSLTACSEVSLNRLHEGLNRTASPDLASLVRQLNEAAASQSLGSAALGLRIPKF